MDENTPHTDQEKILALFAIIDDPQGWYEGLSYQQKLFCRAWLFTGKHVFARALLQKMLPQRLEERSLVAPVEGVQNLVVNFA